MKIKKILIGGEWRETKQTFVANNPYTNKKLAEISLANRLEVEESILLAEEAVKMANQSKYGLQAGVLTGNLANMQSYM